jgi:hypothetical protein
MADSSLSEEMSQFDFSTGVQSFSLGSQNPEGNPRTVAKKASPPSTASASLHCLRVCTAFKEEPSH